MVMGPERPESKVDCIANSRPALSAKRVLHFGIKSFSGKENKRKISLFAT
jgi:hypothetical protein